MITVSQPLLVSTYWLKHLKKSSSISEFLVTGFLIWGSACCCAYFIKVIGRTVLRNNFLECLFIFISPLQVSALAGHLQAQYTIIFGKLPHYNGSVVLCYRSYFVYVSAHTAACRWPARAKTCSGKININEHFKKLLPDIVI
jgi:hypothetical protein